MYINLDNIQIFLDSSVRHLSRVACMAISGSLENGIILTGSSEPKITIYNNRIEFGRSITPELEGISGNLVGNFYREYGTITYRYGSNLKCSFFSKTIEYTGAFPPTTPDNEILFNLIYPKFS